MNSAPLPVASIVIPVKNGAKYLGAVLDAIFAQQADFPFEVLVIDSGSSDGSIQIVDGHLKRFAGRLRAITIGDVDFGHGRTRNLGTRLAGGKYVVFLTQDAIPASSAWLSRLIAPMEANELIVATFGRHYAHPGSNPVTERDLQRHFDMFLDFACERIDDAVEYESNQQLRQRMHFFSNNNSSIRRDVLLALPFPDVMFAEDQAWADSMLRSGGTKAYVDDAAVYHSHEYSAIERLRRSFDEASAFRTTFNYDLSIGPLDFLRLVVARSRGDYHYLRYSGQFDVGLISAARWVVAQAAGMFGTQLGARSRRMPDFLKRSLSHDYRLFTGARSG